MTNEEAREAAAEAGFKLWSSVVDDEPVVRELVEIGYDAGVAEGIRQAREAEGRLVHVARLLRELPIQSAASDREPWAKVNLVDIVAVTNVAAGLDNPEDWVSRYCGKTFEHSPHHWSEYRENETPLRIPHYCVGAAIDALGEDDRGASEPHVSEEADHG